MSDAIQRHYDTFPDPSPELAPIVPEQFTWIDDNLHLGWAWQRHRYAWHPLEDLRILDAGCGTGASTITLATINPGSTVVGVDLSNVSLELGRARARAAGREDVSFVAHDLTQPLPAELGTFDYIVCRRVTGHGQASAILANLAKALNPKGLLFATFPSRHARVWTRAMRQAIEALAPVGSNLAERAAIGLELLYALRPEHPLRRDAAVRFGKHLPKIDAFVSAYLNEPAADFELDDTVKAFEAAGLRWLYASARAPWQPQRVFGQDIPERLQKLAAQLEDARRSKLIDVLEPSTHPHEYSIYGCLATFEPRYPGWPDELASKGDAALADLIPHRSGLAAPAAISPDPAEPRGRITYRTSTGGLGELDAASHALFQAIDGTSTIGEIQARVTLPANDQVAPRDRWMELANHGFILLEPRDPRQTVDCTHLGPIKDRLDCACPRKWVRACDLHGHCTISEVPPGDDKAPALAAALERLQLNTIAHCATCPDYHPEA